MKGYDGNKGETDCIMNFITCTLQILLQ